jgi:NADH dehydrogenase
MAKTRIVILGGGFAGIATARGLERALHPDEAQIVLLSRENFSLFTPMLPEVSSGALDVRHVATPIRSQLRRTQFVLSEIEELDVESSTIAYRPTLSGTRERMHYDDLVLALGSITSTFNLPGIAERVFSLKTLEDAGTLRNRLLWLLELADSTSAPAERRRLLSVAIVGGGFTGVETAGEIMELFHNVSRYYPAVRDDVRVVLVEAGAGLLPGLPAEMGTYAARALQERGVQIVLGDGVKSADDDGIEMQNGTRIETRTIVWSAGVRPNPLLAATPLPRTRSGAIAVAPDMRVPEFPNVWAAGDCAAIPDSDGGTHPPTAQHALREGAAVARNIAAALRGESTVAFRYRARGMMASLGARKAVAQLSNGQVVTGLPAWLLWRAYYLLRLPGMDRRIRVAFDWMLHGMFPRDITELRVYSRRARSSAAVDAGVHPRDDAVHDLATTSF